MKEMQPEMADKFSKEAYLKGIKAVLDADTTQMAYYQGLQMGLQLVNPVIGINNEAKIPVDKNKVLEAFKTLYMADSIGETAQYFGEYQALRTRVQTIMKERHDAEVAASPEAQKNLKDGQAYAEKMVKEGLYKKLPRASSTKSRIPALSLTFSSPTRWQCSTPVRTSKAKCSTPTKATYAPCVSTVSYPASRKLSQCLAKAAR